MKEDSGKPLLSALAGEALFPPPIWLMRQAGRYLPEYRKLREQAGSFWAMCMNSELAAEVTVQPVRRFRFDAAILFSDILVVPYAMGRSVDFENGPKLEAVRDPDDLQRNEVFWAERLEPVYDSIRRVKQVIAPATALLGFAGAPWTLATYLAEGAGSADQRAAKLWGYRDPAGFTHLLERLAECVAFHLVRQIEAGVDAVQIFDSWAGGLPANVFHQWVVAPTRMVVDRVRKVRPDAKIIGFPRATTLAGYVQYARETGVNAISLDSAAPITWAGQSLPAGIAVQGNLDPLALLAGGPAMSDLVEEILRGMRGRPFIFNLGHGVLPDTPIEHVEALVSQVRRQ